MNGQERRDMYFARLFGLTTIIQSSLLFRQDPPAYSSTPASTLEDFQKVLEELVALGGKESWFTESCWWCICLALDALFASSTPWKGQASNWALNALFPSGCEWTPERMGVWLKYHRNWGQEASGKLAPKLKTSHLLASANLLTVARVLRVWDSTTFGNPSVYLSDLSREPGKAMRLKMRRPQKATQGPGNTAHILSGIWSLTRTSLLQGVAQTQAKHLSKNSFESQSTVRVLFLPPRDLGGSLN
jgi:hypothetical protein